ncbi:MAG TPA: shikimate kinase [Flavobacteriaceae bacterium]|nr:shikimate kinase [Flavobacteriaceae bacterium]
MKIVLLGYMASGKTIIANKLSKKKGIKHIDLDAYIEKKEKKSIIKIFKDKGEIYFRIKENFYLNQILHSKDNFILSVGGGTPCYANNMELILKYSKSVFLKANIETIYSRLIIEKEKRPLIKDIQNDNLKEYIAKHLFERSHFYNKSKIQIDVNNKSIEQITEDVLLQISN